VGRTEAVDAFAGQQDFLAQATVERQLLMFHAQALNGGYRFRKG